MNERGARRLGQAISEGDGISVLVEVGDVEAARAAEAQGADALVVREPVGGLGEATELPVVWCADGPAAAEQAGADACLLVAERFDGDWRRLADEYAQASDLGLDCVVEVRDEEELAEVLEHVDPEIVLLAGHARDPDAHALDHLLELLPDVPAGKLAVAQLASASRGDLDALERAGMDGVVVDSRDVTALVGVDLPDV